MGAMASEGAISGKRLMSPLTPREETAGIEPVAPVPAELPVVEPIGGDAVNPATGLSDWPFGNAGLVVAAPVPVPLCCEPVALIEVSSPGISSDAGLLIRLFACERIVEAGVL